MSTVAFGAVEPLHQREKCYLPPSLQLAFGADVDDTCTGLRPCRGLIKALAGHLITYLA